MRAIVFLLIPVNLLFFLWAGGYLGGAPAGDSLRAREILPDRVRIVSRDEAPPLPAKPVPPASPPGASAPTVASPPPEASAPTVPPDPPASPPEKVSEICFSVNDLQVAERARVESLLAGNFPAFSVEYTRASGKSTFWVFIPPRANRQEAEQKVEELKRLNVPEFFVVQEPGPYRFAISLGIFSTESAALERLVSLQSKGVRSAVVGERGARVRSLALRGPETQSDALRRALERAVPGKFSLNCRGSR
ncbi:MAG: hypothetical protein LBM17_00020 [Candidatus Accumulibacter sp.]|jgi:hypothetical protein|nr:hypothetical protein [Accumulibacter sp.]